MVHFMLNERKVSWGEGNAGDVGVHARVKTEGAPWGEGCSFAAGQIDPRARWIWSLWFLVLLDLWLHSNQSLRSIKSSYIKKRNLTVLERWQVRAPETLAPTFLQQCSCLSGHVGALDPQLCLSELWSPAGLSGRMLRHLSSEGLCLSLHLAGCLRGNRRIICLNHLPSNRNEPWKIIIDPSISSFVSLTRGSLLLTPGTTWFGKHRPLNLFQLLKSDRDQGQMTFNQVC